MARRVKDATLDSRDARTKLKPRGKPYWRSIERGLHLGYRRLKGKPGTWWARHYIGEQSYEIEAIGAADDMTDADGIAILDFWQAQDKARERLKSRAYTASGKHGPLTVADAMAEYMGFLDSNRKSGGDARSRYKLHIEPKLGKFNIEDLSAKQLRLWFSGLEKTPRFVRSTAGKPQRQIAVLNTDDARRARRASANRTLTVLKAALNRAWRDSEGKLSDPAWRKVEPFENVDAARVRYLTIAEAQRVINACEADFRKMVQAGLQTGARYSELAALRVHDFNPDTGTVAIRQSKSGKPRHVVLTEEGAAFFNQVCAGRSGDETMFQKAGGGAWAASHQARPMAEACKRAKLKPSIGFHGLRHTWASLAVMAGVPLLVVAKNLGHSDTRMVETHYGHLAPSYVADAIRAGAPRFGF